MYWFFAALVISALSVEAETYGDWQYEVRPYLGGIVGATITGYTGSGGEVTFPNSINGVPVKQVGGGAPVFGFSHNYSVTNIIIPDNVTTIFAGAFCGCKGLTSIIIPSSVTSIGVHAFQESGLTTISISSGLNSINGRAFFRCLGLTNIIVDPANPFYSAIDGVLYDKYKTKVVACPANKIGSFAIPSSVTSIGEYAFNWCTLLTDITIPNSVTTIEAHAFEACDLPSLTMPSSLSSIGEFSFAGCRRLTNITIPSSVISIGFAAFEACNGLTSIYVDPANSFYCAQDGVLYDKYKTRIVSCLLNKTGPFSIPNSVTSIGDYAFSGCNKLSSITIPSSVMSIGSSAFSGCSLTNITVPNSVTSIGDYAFSFCSNLSDLQIPNSVTTIGTAAFMFTALTDVTVPDSVTSIADWLFHGCSKLTKIMIPKTIASIGFGAFYNCTGLTTVTISSSVTNIDSWAFKDCPALTRIVIPNSVMSIGLETFENCPKLNIFLLGNHPNSWSSFNLGNSPATIVLPKVSSFKSWKINNSFRQELRFNSFSGVDYSIESSADLNNWANKVNIVGDGSEMIFLDDATNDKAFYRLIQH
jgi:hypothetical protein